MKEAVQAFSEMRGEWLRIGYGERYINIKRKLYDAKSKLKELCEERNKMLLTESERLVKNARIIGSTLIKSQLPPLEGERFDIVLIDECSQASVTLALLGMVKAKKWVLIGDHKQLLPIFQTLDANDKKLLEKLSVFCYMLEKYGSRAIWLRQHYRSNSEIIGFSQKYVYNGNITPAETCKSIRLELRVWPQNMPFLNPSLPVVFLHVDGEEYVEVGGSRRNELEAEAVKSIVDALKRLNIKSKDIGVITPYRAQRDYIREILKDEGVEVNTVDSFQGREKDVIIFSVTSTKDMEFVEDENRLNVAFTRARKKLIVLGNVNSIKGCRGLLSNFIIYAKERGSLFDYRS
jgi:superfamily I DNA and/or RNA helicase